MEYNKLGFKKQIRIFVQYFILFLIVPIIGTLLHEFGHYIVAISMGYEARIAYAYTTSTINSIKNPDPYFYYILGGPISTWIQSLIPFTMLIIYYNKGRRKEITDKLPPLFIILLAFTSICGRFIFNAGGYMFTHSESMDESKIAAYLGIYPDVFVYPFAFIAWTILLISIYIIPRRIRISIFLGAILGAATGYMLWYYIVGPIVLPVQPFY